MSASLGIIFLYLTVASTMFLFHKRYRTSSFKISSPSLQIIEANKLGVKKPTITAIDVLCLTASVAAFLHTAIDLRWVYGRQNDYGCNLAMKTKVTTFGISLSIVYLVLWMRQRIFYKDPRLNHLSSKLILVISWSIGIFLGLSALSLLLLSVVLVNYEGTAIGCLHIDIYMMSQIQLYVFVACTTCLNIFLLCLFVYPFVRHFKSMKNAGNDGNIKSVINLIKRASIATTVIVITDFALVAIIAILVDISGTVLWFLYDLRLIINIVCLLSSFPDWRRRILPCQNTRTKRRSTTEIVTVFI